MKKFLAILVLGLFLVGCATGPRLFNFDTAEEFERYVLSQGYIYITRAQPRFWVDADGMGIKGGRKPASGASFHSQQEANTIALNLCAQISYDCFVSHISGSLTYEARKLIDEEKAEELKKEKKQKKEEEKKKEEDQLDKEENEKEEEKTEEKVDDDDFF